LIRHNLLEEERRGGLSFPVLCLAVIASVAFNAGLIFGCFLLPGPNSGGPAPLETVVGEGNRNDVDVRQEMANQEINQDPLTVQDIDPAALDQVMDQGFKDIEREAEVNVPGIVDVDVPVAIQGGSMTAPPMDIAPPPGIGGAGQGGGLEIPGLEGTGGIGQLGGYNLSGAAVPQDAFGGARGSGATKQKLIDEGGGGKETEAAVVKGLLWLKRVQSPDGAWRLDSMNFPNPGPSNDIAGTGFGLLPYLGAGHDHLKPKDDKQFHVPVLAGLGFLIRSQNPKDGSFTHDMYGHALATYALCEAYGMSSDVKLRVPAQKAVNFLLYAQHSEGGWRYGPGQAGDLSVSGWCIQALKAAKMAKLYVPDKNWRNAMKFLDAVQSNDGYCYTPGGGPTPTMSAVGLLGRYFLQNWGPNNLSFIKGIQNHIKPTQPAAGNMYYYYYATQVMYQYGGKDWKDWNGKMSKILMANQKNDGSWYMGASGGRLMETSLCILTLEVYYRYLPTYYREKGYRQDQVTVGQ
jgi:hypothetical protein